MGKSSWLCYLPVIELNLRIANTVFGRSSYRKCFLDNRYGQETIYLPRPFTPRIAYRISLTTNHVGRVIMEKSHYILKAGQQLATRLQICSEA